MSKSAAAVTDPAASAKSAGLRYVSDRMPGIRRIGTGKTFRYLMPDGRLVRDPETLQRIRSLVIPPAWTEVWICPRPDGHLQASGRDARKRKQYRYHNRWREFRDETKFDRMVAFGKVLPKIRARVKRDLSLPGLSKEKVLATLVSLLERTFIRIGNEEYSKQNNSFGLTTLRDHHVAFSGAGTKIHFYFRGKSGKRHAIDLEDPHLARIVRRLKDLPGYELFQYIDDDGQQRSIDSSDVNDYLREITGQDFTAKDFRTWAGTVLAASALCKLIQFETERQAKKHIVAAIETVAARLGNTVAVCRKCYIHPAVFEAYMARKLPQATCGEKWVLTFLQSWARKPKLTLEQTLVQSIKVHARRR